MKKLLFISRTLACPNFHGGCVYPYRVLESLAEKGVEVHYFWLGPNVGRPVFRVPFKPSFTKELTVAGARRVGSCFSTLLVPRISIQQQIKRVIDKFSIDCVLLDFLWDAELLKGLSVKTMILTHELIHQRTKSYLEAGIQPDFQPLTEAEEVARLQHADSLIAIHDEDALWLQGTFSNKQVLTVPVPFDLLPLPKAAISPPTVMFIGGNTAHNAHGLNWFLRDVWPLVRRKVGDAQLRIYGTVETDPDLVVDGVNLKGPIADVQSAYAENAVAIVPLQFGSGLKIKLMEAMAYGKAVVSTPIGAEGFRALKDGKICRVASEADSFAIQLTELLQNEAAYDEVVLRQSDWLKQVCISSITALALS